MSGNEHAHGHHGHGHHGHDHVHLDEDHWAANLARTALEGEVFAGFLATAIGWVHELRGPDAPVGAVLDIGPGPGVGTCQLAEAFPAAEVVAVDASPSMLAATAERAAGAGLGARVRVVEADLADGLAGAPRADVIWASMSLHHVGDEVAALAAMGRHLRPGGLVVIAEKAGSNRMIPDDLGTGRPGLGARLDAAMEGWFAEMRHGLPGHTESLPLAEMASAAGLAVLRCEVLTEHHRAPLDPNLLHYVLDSLERAAERFGDRLDQADRDALARLTDPADPDRCQARLHLSAERLVMVATLP